MNDNDKLPVCKARWASSDGDFNRIIALWEQTKPVFGVPHTQRWSDADGGKSFIYEVHDTTFVRIFGIRAPAPGECFEIRAEQVKAGVIGNTEGPITTLKCLMDQYDQLAVGEKWDSLRDQIISAVKALLQHHEKEN